MSGVLPVAMSLPGSGDAASISATATERSVFDSAAPPFNSLASSTHLANPVAFSGEAIGNVLKSYVSRARRHEEAQSNFSKRAAGAVEDTARSCSSPHGGPAYASLEPPGSEAVQRGRDTVTLDMLRAAEAASLEAMSFMFDTSLVVGTTTEASRSFNTLLKAQ